MTVPPAHWEVSRSRVRRLALPAAGITALALVSATGPDWVALLAWLVFLVGGVGYALWRAPRRWRWAIGAGTVLVVGTSVLNFWWTWIRVDPADQRREQVLVAEVVAQARPVGTANARLSGDIAGRGIEGRYYPTHVFVTSALTADPPEVLRTYAQIATETGWVLGQPTCHSTGYRLTGFKQFKGWVADLSVSVDWRAQQVRLALSADAAADPDRTRRLTEGRQKLHRDLSFLDNSCVVGMQR